MTTNLQRRSGRGYLPVLVFLACFAVLLVVVCNRFMYPALQAASSTTQPAQRHQIAALSSLVVTVVFFVLLIGFFLTFRIHRFFFPRPGHTRPAPTKYVDAWKESGRRMQVPDEEE